MKKAARKKKESFFEKVSDDIQKVVKEEEKVIIVPTKKFFQKRPFQAAAFIIVFIIIGILVYLQVSNLKDAPTEAGKLSSDEVTKLVAELGEKMLLPEGETPTIATVTDITKLADQPFFKNAKNGDKVIIYGSTKEAILYRPTLHKIIAVAPINATEDTQAQLTPAPVSATPAPNVTLTPTPTPAKLKVVVLNSTKTVGLARKGAAFIDKDKYDIATANATGSYEKTTISNVNKDKRVTDTELKQIISSFGSVKPSIAPLPTSESAPEGADIVIILGEDFSAQ